MALPIFVLAALWQKDKSVFLLPAIGCVACLCESARIDNFVPVYVVFCQRRDTQAGVGGSRNSFESVFARCHSLLGCFQ